MASRASAVAVRVPVLARRNAARDLGRHPRQERRLRPGALPRGDPAAGGRRAGRDRRRRLRVDDGSLDARARRARSYTRFQPAEFGHGATRNLAVGLSSGDLVVFTSPGRGRGGRALAAAARGGRAERPGVAGAYGRQLAHDGRAAARGVLPRLHVRAGSAGAAARRGVEELTFEATLFSNVELGDLARASGRLPVRRRRVDERGPGVVAPRCSCAGHTIVYEPRAAVRHSHAYTIRAAFRRFFDSGVSAERGLRRRRGVARRAPAAGRRYAVGSCVALAVRTRRWIPSAVGLTSSGSSPASSSGCADERLPRRLRVEARFAPRPPGPGRAPRPHPRPGAERPRRRRSRGQVVPPSRKARSGTHAGRRRRSRRQPPRRGTASCTAREDGRRLSAASGILSRSRLPLAEPPARSVGRTR